MSVVEISALAAFFPGKRNLHRAGQRCASFSSSQDVKLVEEKLIKKGENALESNRQQSFVYDGSMGSMKGKVKASMKKSLWGGGELHDFGQIAPVFRPMMHKAEDM